MKKCYRCGAEKPYTEFYKHKQMADGYIGKCKYCTKIDVRKNRADKVEYYRQYDVKRYQSDPSVRKRINASSRRWREKNPDKYNAHNAVSNAIRDGRLSKEPCEVCGAKYVHGHHDDYSKPLEVRWLCPIHHREHHDQQA